MMLKFAACDYDLNLGHRSLNCLWVIVLVQVRSSRHLAACFTCKHTQVHSSLACLRLRALVSPSMSTAERFVSSFIPGRLKGEYLYKLFNPPPAIFNATTRVPMRQMPGLYQAILPSSSGKEVWFHGRILGDLSTGFLSVGHYCCCCYCFRYF